MTSISTNSRVYEEHIMATQVETKIDASKTPRFIHSYPFVGNLLEYRKDRLSLLRRIAREGDVCGMHFGPFPGFLFNKPNHIHSILVEHAYSSIMSFTVHKS